MNAQGLQPLWAPPPDGPWSLGQPWSTHSKSLSPGGGQAVCLCLSYTSLL